MWMRSEFLKRKEIIAGLIPNPDEKIVQEQLEAVHDMMLDLHQKYIDEANTFYLDFFNRLDPAYVPEFGDTLYATMKVSYANIPMLSTVTITRIFPTGVVEFFHDSNKKVMMRLFADELQNYRTVKINMVDSRDVKDE